MPAVHLLTSDPSGHAGKSLPELTDGQTLVMVKLKYLRGSHDDSWFKPGCGLWGTDVSDFFIKEKSNTPKV